MAKWLLQWGQDTQPDPVTKFRCNSSCTSMNFLQVPHNTSMSISRTKSFDSTYFQPMQQAKASRNAGYRWGVSPNALDFPAGSSYSKNFLYQLGTASSSLLPNVVTLGVANAIADSYLQPARVTLTAVVGGTETARGGEFDPSAGCYRIVRGCGTSSVHFMVDVVTELRYPVFCIAVDEAQCTQQARHQQQLKNQRHHQSDSYRYLNSASIAGKRLLSREVVSAVEAGDAVGTAWVGVVQILRRLPPGRHAVQFEEAVRGSNVLTGEDEQG